MLIFCSYTYTSLISVKVSSAKITNFLSWNLAKFFWNFCNVSSSPKWWSKAVSKWIAGGQLFTTLCQLLGKQWLLGATQLVTRCLFKLEREKAKATPDQVSPNISYIIVQIKCGNERSFDLCVCVYVDVFCVFISFFVW